MERQALLRLLDSPRRVALSREVWEAAAILAGLRERANDPIRATDRDRGQDKNWLADIWGVLGEIAALRTINEIAPTADVEHHPIDFERSVNDVDLIVDLDDGLLRLETKAHLLDQKKKWFMVNARAHQRSLGRGAVGYLPILSVLGAPRVLVGSLLTVSELSGWGAPTVRLNDPAIGVLLGDLAASHFDGPLATLSKALQDPPALVGVIELSELAARAGRDFDLWRQELRPLDRLTARGLRDEVLATRGRVEQRRRP